MESRSKPPGYPGENSEEVDLRLVFHKAVHVLTRIFLILKRVMIDLGDVTIRFIFFLRRNLLWLILGTLMGLGLGIYLNYKKGDRYVSEMTVKMNFSSGRTMFGALNHFNDLIEGHRNDELSQIFDISVTEAASLLRFEASPENNEVMLVEEYTHQFLKPNKFKRSKSDIDIEQTFSFDDFKNSLTKFDYPAYRISVTSSNPTVFSKVENGIINQISSNKLLQRLKQVNKETNKEAEETLKNSIKSLDTLRKAYFKRIAAPPEPSNVADSNVIDRNESGLLKNPELESYDIMLDLNNELKTLRNKSATEAEIVDIYSPLSSFGKKESFLKQYILKYSLIGLCVTFILLLMLKLSKWLSERQKKYNQVST